MVINPIQLGMSISLLHTLTMHLDTYVTYGFVTVTAVCFLYMYYKFANDCGLKISTDTDFLHDHSMQTNPKRAYRFSQV